MKKKSTILTVLGYLKRYWFLIIVSLAFACASVLLSLYIPIIVGDGIDLIIDTGMVDFEALLPLITNIGIIALIVALLQWLMNLINNRITYNVTKDIRNRAFDKIHNLPLSYIDSNPSGAIVNKIISDVDQFAEGLLMGFTQFFSGIVTIIATLIIMLMLSWKIALVVILLTPLSLFVASFISKSTYSLFKKQSESKAEGTAIINEVIGNLKVVKAFSREDKELERFDKANDKLERVSRKAIFFSSLVNPCTRFVNSLVYAGVALVGALLVIKAGGGVDGALTVGVLSVFLSYATQYAKPFNEISGVITELQNSLACAKRVFDFTNEKEEESDLDNAELVIDDGDIKLSHVSFSYTDDKKLIEDLNLKVESGMHVAIVGPTGCGKTTLINLLMRFYDVKSGEIWVDNQNIKEITRHSLRSSYGMVLQDTWLQNGTVRQNIALGKPNATENEIIEAAKASHAHSFIKRLPNGYDTVISDENSSLSQGQRQLLCIARIMLALPPMLILDEATSSIDTRTEIKIQKAFSTLMQGRTSFIVAHRLSTIKEADLILVMKDGNIIEMGNHEELLIQNGFYATLYNSQFEPSEELL
ncbi:MAG: ABC transporter ATP-binding protein [Ruminococcaceae bacterium]|nr:ABC transporter ATP-binding protein [Oscillospiraceae bacterium]